MSSPFSSFYRLQRSWGKVMFLHLYTSVILFTGGEGVVSQHALQVVSQHALQVSRPTPRGKLKGLAWGGVSRSTPRRGVYPNMH